ncbi:SPJ_0845 family protein [Liquorilactobacillus aquaticus]|nr:SPJ_0845 family protein [Liquorilactobacillus aquaticus]
MGLTVNRQNQLDKMFEKFAVDPVEPPKKKEKNSEKAKKDSHQNKDSAQ